MKLNEINILGAKRFKECRIQSGYTQEQLAEKSNYSIQQISYIENAKRALSIEAAYIFSKIFNVSYEYLLCESPYRNSDLQEQHSSVMDDGLEKSFRMFMEFLGYRFGPLTPPSNDGSRTKNIYDDTYIVVECLYPETCYFKITLRDFYNLKNDIMAYAQFKFSSSVRTSPKDMSNLHLDEIKRNMSTVCNEERLMGFDLMEVINTQVDKEWERYYSERECSTNNQKPSTPDSDD